ncbi:DUF2523 domain-containing protein [Salmonella enterica subsp. enterica]|nr:DUF2523 domain-containing protein [Salmonella enterica]ECB1044579.1 DUF2523 domain-containing protein [Salmonella enterica subsp. enterica serovar Aschersleben]ECD6618953.1 DUF2523 domain-containing protein [Salmonella enterica subsp. enterica]EHW1154864.1 DUF2523 domain-containing protein [Salmonella enterica subsp. enterica serovar Takoradi]EIP0098196.1 DUF2523 domain-containing protein [Salmonella enterica subsp. enterica serovar Wangata]
MFAILISALNTMLSFLLRRVVFKFVLFGALFVLCTAIPPLITSHLPDVGSLYKLLNSVPDGVWYFLGVFEFPRGLSVVIPAYFVRFFIRRIPFFG